MSLLGQELVERRLIGAEQLADALRVARDWKVRLGQALLARVDVRSADFHRALAANLKLE